MTKRRKIFVIIPIIIVALLLMYTWITFLTTEYIAILSHYVGLLLFLPVLYFLRKDKSFKRPLIFAGIYLALGTTNILSFLPFIMAGSIHMSIGSIKLYSPAINWLALLIFIIYGIMNFDTLVDIYYDYKEAKGKL